MPLKKGLSAPQNTFLDTIAQRFDGTHSNFVLGNANAGNNPIVYVSDGFCELTRCQRAFVMCKSCSCSFLYGDQTSENGKRRLDQALQNKEEVKLELVLYRKNGQSFWCLLDVIPIKNERGDVTLFLVSFKDITKERLNATSYSSILLKPGDSKKDRHRVTFALKSMASAAQTLASVTSQSVAHDPPPAPHAHTEVSLDAGDAESNVSVRIDTENTNTHTKSEEEGSATGVIDRDADADGDDGVRGAMSMNRRKNLSRRRSRAVLYHLSGHFQQQRKPKNKLHMQSLPGKDAFPEYKVQHTKSSRLILRHYGLVRFCWDSMIMLCTFYIAIMVPYHAAFLDFEEDKKFRIADIAVEVFFMIDIILNFRTTYVNASGQVVYDPRNIAWNYAHTWFLLDFCAAIPFDFLEALTVEIGIKVHLLKLARLLRLARLLQKIDRYSQYSYIILLLLTGMFALVAHWLACIWYTIGREEFERNDANWTVGWLPELATRLNTPFDANKTRGESGPSVFSCYISALYFTCSSLTSVGFGNVSANTVAEKIFSVCAMLAGALMHAVVFGNVTAIIQRMYSRRAAYQSKYNDLKDFIKAHHLPKQIKQRLNEFFQTSWSISHGICVDEIMKEFPEELRGDIAMHLYREALSISVLGQAPLGCRKRLAYEGIRYRFCTPGEFLLHTGDHVSSLSYICSGSIEILRDGLVVAILGKGDLFGADFRQLGKLKSPASRTGRSRSTLFAKLESVVRQEIQTFRSNCDVRALTYCDLQLIDIEKLYFLLLNYEEYACEFYSELGSELTFNLAAADYAETDTDSEDSLLGDGGRRNGSIDGAIGRKSPSESDETTEEEQSVGTRVQVGKTERSSGQDRSIEVLSKEVAAMRRSFEILDRKLSMVLANSSFQPSAVVVNGDVVTGSEWSSEAAAVAGSMPKSVLRGPALSSLSVCFKDIDSIASND